MALALVGLLLCTARPAVAADAPPTVKIVFFYGSGRSSQCAPQPGFKWDDGESMPPPIPATIGPYPVGTTLRWWFCAKTQSDPSLVGQDSYGTWYGNGQPPDPNTQYSEYQWSGTYCLPKDGCPWVTHQYNTAGQFDFWMANTGYRATVLIGDQPPPSTTTTTGAPAVATTTAVPTAPTVAAAPTAAPRAATPATTTPAIPASTTTTVAEQTTTTSSTVADTSTTAPTDQVAINQTGSGGGRGYGVPIAGGVAALSLAGLGVLWWRRRSLSPGE